MKFLFFVFLVVAACNNEGWPASPTPQPESPTAEVTASLEPSPTPCTAVDWYSDGDGDGYGSVAVSSINACESPGEGWVEAGGDCADADATINPGATETCNGIDDNCDGEIDENVMTSYYQDADYDGYGNASMAQSACSQPTGYVVDNTDCNDADLSVHPGATETCNGIDDNCNGDVDDGFDRDGDGFTSCGGDCADADASVYPGAAEICGDDKDNNCNGDIDETCRLPDADARR